jgi:predicted nuclease of predicted toxin-antitoxin system
LSRGTRRGFLVDEDVPHDAAQLLIERGYQIELARAILGSGRSDAEIAAYSISADRIVVTRNVRDYRRLSRTRAFRRLSYLGLSCQPESAVERLSETLDVIDYFIDRARQLNMPFNMEIGSETFSVRDR